MGKCDSFCPFRMPMTFNRQIPFIKICSIGILIQIQDESVQGCVWECVCVRQHVNVGVGGYIRANVSLTSLVNLLSLSPSLEAPWGQGSCWFYSPLWSQHQGWSPRTWQMSKYLNEWINVRRLQEKKLGLYHEYVIWIWVNVLMIQRAWFTMKMFISPTQM